MEVKEDINMLFKKHFGQYYLKYLAVFLIGILILVTIDYIQLEIPKMVNVIITEMNALNDSIGSGLPFSAEAVWQIVNPILRNLLIIVAGMVIGRFLWRYLLFGTARKIEADVRLKMFTHTTKLSQSFYSQEKVGALMSRFTNDLEAVRQSYALGLLMLVDGLVLGGLVLYRMFSIHWQMTLFAFIPLVIMAIVVLILSKKIQKKFKERQEAVESMTDFTQENFSGISVIKAYVKEIRESKAFADKTDTVYKKDISFVRFAIIVNIAVGFTIILIATLIVIFGSYLIANDLRIGNQNGMSPGLLTEYVSYFFTLLWPVQALSQFIYIHSQAKASAARIGDLLDEKVTIFDEDHAVEPKEELTGAIRVEHLTFKYPDGDNPVLEDVSFKIKAGEMVGILGRTGSGKSSLVELLLRIYNAPKSSIFYDEYDMMDVPVKTLRSQIGYVPQDNFLYSDTIRENIGFAYENPSEDVIENAAKLSDVYDNIIDFKEGFETVLGERGVTVSGGQKQRISIARAIAKDPKILILDDSVSAVDTKTEEAIISNLRRIRKEKTTIIIAHRISTVKKMDKIVLLDKGRLIGFGSHNELLKTSTVYQEMVKLQELEKLVEEGK